MTKAPAWTAEQWLRRICELLEEMSLPKPLAYDVTTAAKLVGLSRSKLEQLIEQGRLSVVRIDRRRLVTPEALRKLLEESSSHR